MQSTTTTAPHTRLHKPKPPHTTRDPTPATSGHPLPKVSYILRPRPLPISGAFQPDQLRAMIDRLPDARHREIITLRYQHGYQWADIASTMAYERTSIYRMHKAAIHQINQMVRKRISVKPAPAKTRIAGKGWLGAAFTVGLALMAIAWWITDTALLTSEAGQYSRWIIDLDKLRPWAVALWIGGPVAGWYARIQYERMPVAKPKTEGGENTDGLYDGVPSVRQDIRSLGRSNLLP